MAIVGNVTQRADDANYIGESVSKLKVDFCNKGFLLTSLWDKDDQFSGFVIMEFEKSWVGFNNALIAV